MKVNKAKYSDYPISPEQQLKNVSKRPNTMDDWIEKTLDEFDEDLANDEPNAWLKLREAIQAKLKEVDRAARLEELQWGATYAKDVTAHKQFLNKIASLKGGDV